jgi:hypothetical protein
MNYQYRVTTPKISGIHSLDRMVKLEIWLNEFGIDGWKLLHVDAGQYIFIREIE